MSAARRDGRSPPLAIAAVNRDDSASSRRISARTSAQVRLFYVFEPGQIIRLLGGMVKKQDRIPADVLARMRGHQKDARERLKKAKTEKKR